MVPTTDVHRWCPSALDEREHGRIGLRRHQVENLVLRGPIFCWRARIPVGLGAPTLNARLSLSLRLSDRKKASLVARRLNALLLEVELIPAARMATNEQLTRIFALELSGCASSGSTLSVPKLLTMLEAAGAGGPDNTPQVGNEYVDDSFIGRGIEGDVDQRRFLTADHHPAEPAHLGLDQR